MRATRNESGAGTVSAVLWIGILMMLAAAMAMAIAVISTHRRSQSAADLAALAGAQAHQSGGDGCAQAGEIARRNGARVLSCRRAGDDVLVTVAIRAPFEPGPRLRARARAGPSQAGGVAPTGWD